MHIFFSGIGGSGVGPLAVIAQQAGHQVTGSDKQASSYTEQLQAQGIELYIGQTAPKIAAVHARQPIDWLVYSSALPREDPNHPELAFARQAGIKHSLRDELLKQIIQEQGLQLVGVAGTHGKSTTTAMMIWLFGELGQSLSYSIGAKLPFGPMGQLAKGSHYFVYECDEFDNNFLAFRPELALITGIGWDHHEVFPTKEAYRQAFRQFLRQSNHALLWQEDSAELGLKPAAALTILNEADMRQVNLPGRFNRRDAWLAIQGVHRLTRQPLEVLTEHINRFPGLKQRMERLAPNLYTNYAHTPEKIRGGMSAALEIAAANHQPVVAIYEPLTNRRQHHIKQDYKDSFKGAKRLYWVRTYLAREDPDLPLLGPAELIQHLDDPRIAQPAEIDTGLLQAIREHLKAGDMVVAFGASGAGSLDEWLRAHLRQLTD